MGLINTEALAIINHLILPVVLCALAAPAWGQDAALNGDRPLDRTVPAGAPTRTWGSATNLDDTRRSGPGDPSNCQGGAVGRGRCAGQCSDLPYGAGYEARHGQGGGMGRRH